MISRPELTEQFANIYISKFGGNYEMKMEMMAYHCPKVIVPQKVSGEIGFPSLKDFDFIAEFCAGFIYWGFNKTVTKESQLKSAENLINSGNLFVWSVNGDIVSMANIAHRSPRHARINNVYTAYSDPKQVLPQFL